MEIRCLQVEPVFFRVNEPKHRITVLVSLRPPFLLRFHGFRSVHVSFVVHVPRHSFSSDPVSRRWRRAVNVSSLSDSQKLEETVAENARLEQDLVVLRQKLQASRRYAGNMARDTSATTGPLEAELRRVQQLVGDLQRQRKELSVRVRQLTEKSHSLVQQIRPQPPSGEFHVLRGSLFGSVYSLIASENR